MAQGVIRGVMPTLVVDTDTVKFLRDLSAVAQLLNNPERLARHCDMLDEKTTELLARMNAANEQAGELKKLQADLDERTAAAKRDAERQEASFAAREKVLGEAESKKARELDSLKRQRESVAAELASGKAEAEAARDEYRRKLAALNQAA